MEIGGNDGIFLKSIHKRNATFALIFKQEDIYSKYHLQLIYNMKISYGSIFDCIQRVPKMAGFWAVSSLHEVREG